MIIEFDDTMDYGEVLSRARKQVNGDAPNGIRYKVEIKDGKKTLNVEPI